MSKYVVLIALVLAGTAWAKPAPEAGNVMLKPTPDQTQAAVLATRFLTRFHYKAEPLDAKMSAQAETLQQLDSL